MAVFILESQRILRKENISIYIIYKINYIDNQPNTCLYSVGYKHPLAIKLFIKNEFRIFIFLLSKKAGCDL